MAAKNVYLVKEFWETCVFCKVKVKFQLFTKYSSSTVQCDKCPSQRPTKLKLLVVSFFAPKTDVFNNCRKGRELAQVLYV